MLESLVKTTLIGLFFGTFGTTLGGILGLVLKKNSNKFLSFILSLAAGLMTAIVCFELIPEALEISNMFNVIIGVILGIILMIICDVIVDNLFNKQSKSVINNNKKVGLDSKQSLLKTGIIVSIGLAIHNFPEGLAIGSGFEASLSLGYSLAIAIALHDIPEGLSMAIPLKNGGIKKLRVIFYIVLSGVTTGIGALFGALVGKISLSIISICLSFAAGAMLYIVSGELIPESNSLYKGRMSAIGNIIGFILGILSIM